MAGEDIVATKTAALDLIKNQDFIEGSLPAPLKRTDKGHLFQQIHGKGPYIQVDECAKIGLGDKEYRITKIR